MTEDFSALLREIHAMVYTMKPHVEMTSKGLERIDERLRSQEELVAQHVVKIDRINEDLDGLGRSIRHVSDAIPDRPKTWSWHSVFDVLSAIPIGWKVVIPLLTVFSSFIIFLLKFAQHLESIR